jgi:hypothetical protein
MPGRGRTPERFRALFEFARQDLSLARLAEAHNDAMAILTEAGREARRDALYGVWASEAPPGLRASWKSGHWQLDGTKQYCSGAGLLEAALVTAQHGEESLLFELNLPHPGVHVESSRWATPALADTETRALHFNGVTLAPQALIQEPGWYLNRLGFWHGAIGPAACWAGGARFLVDAAGRNGRDDPHTRAQRGALEAVAWGLEALLEVAGREIDSDPGDRGRQARSRALKLRHLIERHCLDVQDRFGRATGPLLLAFDHEVARQYGALTVYLRQCHAERDLALIME